MAYEAPPIRIGDLRWPCQLATRKQAPDPAGTGVIETFEKPRQVYASIKPIGLQLFIAGEDIDNGPTHRIIFRFMDRLDTFDVILAQLTRQDGSTRQTLYRVFRVSEWEGRQRFTCVDAILEKTVG